MGMAVVTVASGGLPVCDVALDAGSISKKHGHAVYEAANGRGIAVTKVAANKGGLPVFYTVDR